MMGPPPVLNRAGTTLIVAAVPQELRDFRSIAGTRSVECLLTGMGRRAGAIVQKRLSAGGVGLVVSTGFAGGLRPGLKVGDLVMASEVIQASSGERRRPDPSFFEMGGLACTGPFVTVDRLLPKPRQKAEVGARFGAIAVDMESAAVVHVADETGVAWVAVRAILDPMEVSLRWWELFGFLRTMRTASRALAGGLRSLMERR